MASEYEELPRSDPSWNLCHILQLALEFAAREGAIPYVDDFLVKPLTNNRVWIRWTANDISEDADAFFLKRHHRRDHKHILDWYFQSINMDATRVRNAWILILSLADPGTTAVHQFHNEAVTQK